MCEPERVPQDVKVWREDLPSLLPEGYNRGLLLLLENDRGRGKAIFLSPEMPLILELPETAFDRDPGVALGNVLSPGASEEEKFRSVLDLEVRLFQRTFFPETTLQLLGSQSFLVDSSSLVRLLADDPTDEGARLIAAALISEALSESSPWVRRMSPRILGRTEKTLALALDDLFVLKTNIESSGDNELLHEFLVALLGLNPLRSLLPTFAYIYAVLPCAPPFLSDNKVTSWCAPGRSSEGPLTLVSEPIEGVSLTGLLSSLSREEMGEVLAQVVGALILAWRRCLFTHYDLHTGNILVRRLDSPTRIYAPGERALSTSLLVTVLDFGSSFFSWRGRGFGWFIPSVEVRFDRPWPMYDVYKLLLYSANGVSLQVYDYLDGLFSFFGEGPMAGRRGERKGGDDFFQPGLYGRPLHRETSYEEFYSWLLDRSPFLSFLPPLPGRPLFSWERFEAALVDSHPRTATEVGALAKLAEAAPPAGELLRRKREEIRSALEIDRRETEERLASRVEEARKTEREEGRNYSALLRQAVFLDDALSESRFWLSDLGELPRELGGGEGEVPLLRQEMKAILDRLLALLLGGRGELSGGESDTLDALRRARRR